MEALKGSHVRRVDKDDELMWSRNSTGGFYSPKLGYKVIREEEDHQEPLCWYKTIWKIHCSLKTKFFL